MPRLQPVWSADLTRGEARLEEKEGSLMGTMKEDRGMLSLSKIFQTSSRL